jgi:hypothetical protein
MIDGDMSFVVSIRTRIADDEYISRQMPDIGEFDVIRKLEGGKIPISQS